FPLGAAPSDVAARLCHNDSTFHSWVDAFLLHADLGIQGIEIGVTEDGAGSTVSQRKLEGSEEDHVPYFIHNGEQSVEARFSLWDESDGTQQLFDMLVPLYEVLREGELAISDDLSASLHPSLVRELIRVFHDPELNPKGAQLVFATHDTSLLSGKLFRRDQ